MTLLNNWRENNTALTDHCEDLNLPASNADMAWYKDKNWSIRFKFAGLDANKLEERFDSLLKKYSKNRKQKKLKPKKVTQPMACKVTISDLHVGMNPLPESSLFSYEYGEAQIREGMETVYNAIHEKYSTYGTFDLVMIDDLGDMQDGWGGQTTRGGHSLPQNMTEDEVFDLCVDIKVELIERLIQSGMTNKVILRSVVNDNHSGLFNLIVNKAIKKLVNRVYSEEVVEVDILERFMEHRFYGNHCFILTHGKDKQHMNRGLPLNLTDRAKNFINDYIDHYAISSPYVHVEKGDLHQLGYERTKRFDYRNYGSFAPPSAWVQHNFGDSYSCFSLQIIPKYCNKITHTDYFLDYKKIDHDVTP